MGKLQRKIEIRRIDEQGRVILTIEFLNSKVSLSGLLKGRFNEGKTPDGVEIWSCGSTDIGVSFPSPEIAREWISGLTEDVRRLNQRANETMGAYQLFEKTIEILV